MSIKSGLFAAATTVVLILVLGNRWVDERSAEADSYAPVTRLNITGSFRFQFWDMPSEIRTGVIVRLVLLVVLAGLLGAIAGRARPLAAFLGGWSAFLAAALISGGVYGVIIDDRFTTRPGSDVVDSFTLTASFGTAPGMWLGWLVGLAVLLGSFGKGQPGRADTRPAPAPGAWNAPPPPPSHDAPGSHAPGPPPAPPVIGTPPDRTQVFGEPPRRE